MIALFLYRIISFIFSPIIYLLIRYRLFKGKEDASRLNERFGFPTRSRPKSTLIWLHGASVGECLSMLPLINKIIDENKDAHVMVTSGTVTSAELMKKRLPERAFHQFIPIDTPLATKRFVKHWNPDLVLWFESDFWPNILYTIHKQKKPLVLLNGRISDKSFERWKKHAYSIKFIQSLFTLSFGQTEEDERRLKILGAKNTAMVGNLKFSAVNPPFDQNELNNIRNQIGSRPNWCMASTHDDEEMQGVYVHNMLKKKHSNLLTIIVPRHPNRAHDLEDEFISQGLNVSRRSRNEPIYDTTDIYLADTIGEMGLLYQLSNIVFVGGSLVEFGGQNMLEPMRLKRQVIIGPHAFNFREIVKKSKSQNALIEVSSKEDLAQQIDAMLLNPSAYTSISQNAYQLATSEMAVLDRLWSVLSKNFKL